MVVVVGFFVIGFGLGDRVIIYFVLIFLLLDEIVFLGVVEIFVGFGQRVDGIFVNQMFIIQYGVIKGFFNLMFV